MSNDISEQSMSEAAMVMADLPTITPYPTEEERAKGITDGFNQKPNAFVAISKDGTRLEILPLNGGWLGCDVKEVEGDIAPFCG